VKEKGGVLVNGSGLRGAGGGGYAYCRNNGCRTTEKKKRTLVRNTTPIELNGRAGRAQQGGNRIKAMVLYREKIGDEKNAKVRDKR